MSVWCGDGRDWKGLYRVSVLDGVDCLGWSVVSWMEGIGKGEVQGKYSYIYIYI